MQRRELKFQINGCCTMEHNRQYLQMLAAAREKLSGMAPGAIARATGFSWDGSVFAAESLGIPFQIRWADLDMIPMPDMWHRLIILQYMAIARDIPLTGRYISLCDFREGGLARGSSFDRENARMLRIIGKHDANTIQKAASELGGTAVPGKADLSLRFPFLPKFPMVLNLWLEDEEFPASGKVLLDAAAENFLQVEAAGTATGILLAMLNQSLGKL